MKGKFASLLTLTSGLAACSAFLGVSDLEIVDPSADAGDLSDALIDTATDGPAPATDAPSDSRIDGSCASTCLAVGSVRCLGVGVQTCMRVFGTTGTCLAWGAPAACAPNQICCATDGPASCVPVDNSNCFACGAACSGATPQCRPLVGKCGCSVRQCSGQLLGCDQATGACVACDALPANATDIYVDPSGFASATGTPTCPFPTITQAIAAARASVKTRVLAANIHVAPGTYSAASGEVFPFFVEGGISLIGAGSGKSIILGRAPYDHTIRGGQFAGPVYASIIIGDQGRQNVVEGFTLRPTPLSPAPPVAQNFAIFCDQGNLTSQYPADPIPPSNTSLTDISIEPYEPVGTRVAAFFGFGLVASTSTYPAIGGVGCNAHATAFRVSQAYAGAWVVGCGLDSANGHDAASAALEVGTTTSTSADSASSFTGNSGFGIVAQDCARSLKVTNATFSGLPVGISLVQHAPADAASYNLFEFRSNVFQNLTVAGISSTFATTINDLENNSFTGITPDPAKPFPPTPVAAVLFDQTAAMGPADFPAVVRARSNQFIGNDNGVVYLGSQFFVGPALARVQDWGSKADPGKNEFRCNSVLGTAPMGAAGFDLRFDMAPLTTKRQIVFTDGNAWDHIPVNVRFSVAGQANGMDYVHPTLDGYFDPSSGTVATDACPTGRVP